MSDGPVKVRQTIERGCCHPDDLRAVKCATSIPAPLKPKFCIHCGQYWVLESYTDAAGSRDSDYARKSV